MVRFIFDVFINFNFCAKLIFFIKIYTIDLKFWPKFDFPPTQTQSEVRSSKARAKQDHKSFFERHAPFYARRGFIVSNWRFIRKSSFIGPICDKNRINRNFAIFRRKYSTNSAFSHSMFHCDFFQVSGNGHTFPSIWTNSKKYG